VYGIIHEIFRDRLTGTNVVAMMELGDHHLDIVSRAGKPVIYVAARIHGFHLTDPDAPASSLVQLYSCMEPGCLPFGTQEIDIASSNGSTNWLSMFSVDLSRCSDDTTSANQSFVDIGMRNGHDSDEWISNQVALDIDCAALTADVTQQLWNDRHIYRAERVLGRGTNGLLAAIGTIDILLQLQNR
jgi:hypothetical protein